MANVLPVQTVWVLADYRNSHPWSHFAFFIAFKYEDRAARADITKAQTGHSFLDVRRVAL